MITKIQTLFRITADMKKQSVSMRRKLMLYWCVMILTAVCLLLFVLSLAGIFSNEDQKLHESLRLQLRHTEQEISQHLDQLTAQSLIFSEQISRELERMLVVNGKKISDLNDSPELLLELQQNLYEKLYTTLRVSECSGAYFLLDVTTNTKIEEADYSRSGMYLRYANLNTKSAAIQDIVYFRGIPDIARREHIELHNRWNLEFDSAVFPGYRRMIGQKVSDLSKTGYWTDRFRLTDTWEDVILLSVPILDNHDTVIGFCGVEISSLYFYLSYPSIESPYGSMTTVLAPMDRDHIRMEKGLMASSDSTHMDSFETLEIKENMFYNQYNTQEGAYLGLHRELEAAVSDGDQMGVAALVKKFSYDEVIRRNRNHLIILFLGFFLIMFGLSAVLTKRFVKPIADSFQVIQEEAIPEDHQSGISEIDMLLEFVRSKKQHQNVKESILPPNIEELFCLFLERVELLTTSERRIFHYYVEGMDAAEIAEKAFISMSTVRKHSGNIYKKLCISSRDELMLYVDLFRRSGRLEELKLQNEV